MAPLFFNLLTKNNKRKQIKNRKKKTQGKQDRLSDLPDSLIIYILCLLDLKNVVQTSALSKRWNLLWTEIDTVTVRNQFEPDNNLGPNERRKQVRDYLSSLDKTITSISRIRDFTLTGFRSFFCCFTDDIVGKWIEYALESNVETMYLDYEGLVSHPPRLLFCSLSLTELGISEGNYDWGTLAYLPVLKILSMSDIYLGDGRLEAIFVGCHVLETLLLTNITCLNTMRIISPSLKRLLIISVKYEGFDADHLLEINTPLLEDLEILGYFMARKCVFTSLWSLLRVSLAFKICLPLLVDDDGDVIETDDMQRTVEEMLKSVCHVGDLVIGGNLFQVLTMRKPSLTLMCGKLRIVSVLHKYDLPGIVYLLEKAPQVESLIVEVYVSETVSVLHQVKEDYFVNHLHMIRDARGNLFHLKNIEIEYKVNPDYPTHFLQFEEKCFDFGLVDYILRSSCAALERLTLRSLKACGKKTECLQPDCAFQYVNHLSSKLVMHSLPLTENAASEPISSELNKQEFAFDFRFHPSTV